ncbi:MAG: CRTAC1 family protein [Xanthomonadaceae bacterium]|nr:CRTAC1 family protein [Xanthomonadaceae bacterium]
MNEPIDDDTQYEDAREQDDTVIGVVFRRSVLIILVAVLLAGVVFGVRYLLESAPAPEVVQARVDLDSLLAPAATPEPPLGVFTDVTAAAGIDFVHESGAFGERLLPETMGGGVAFIDYDGNGTQDLLFVSSARWPFDPDGAESASATLRLYHNDGHGNFHEVTDAVGLGGLDDYGMGVAVGDYDGNGRTDIFITAVGENRLYRNEGGRFADVTAAAGVGGGQDTWSTGAAFFDANNNGYLDLFVVNYVQWSREIDIQVDYRLTGVGRAYGPPTNFAGTRSYLYINNGDGTFTEQGVEAGLNIVHPTTGEPIGKGLALIPVDLDGDGHIDVMVANDTVRNFVFHNRGDGTFDEVGTDWGLGFDRNGHATGAMGIDFANHTNAAPLAIAIGNFANEMSSFYVSQGDTTQYADQTILEGIGAATRSALTFGVFFFDYDLDGRLDYLQANGHVENEINRVQASQQYRQPGQLFWNCATECPGTFLEVPASRIGALATPMVGRGAAYADIDGNGRLDVVLTQIGGPALLLRNDLESAGNWLRVRLRGKGPNTDAIGARLVLEAGGVTQYRTVMPTRGYLSQVELPVTFGLGDTESIDRLTVAWPDGSEQVISGLTVNTAHDIAQR